MSLLNWLFVDLNSYFASVEQQLQPKLRGKPVGVVPLMADTTCCIAASYEAKAFGVKTGTMVGEAKRMCPGIVFVEARHEEYVKYHEAIVTAVESCLPVTAVMSIDEMACRLTGRDQKLENAFALGKQVKKSILKVGDQLRSSVGLATNRFLSKVASNMQKPDGLTVLESEDLPQALLRLKPSDFPGIGPRMNERLKQRNIRTTEQLLALDAAQMRRIWGGVGGERFYRWLRGEDIDVEYAHNKSVGHSHVLPPELRNPKSAYAVTLRLLQKAAVRLRKLESWATHLSLSISYTDRTHWDKTLKMLECQDTLTLQEVLNVLWEQRAPGNPMKVGVTLSGLIPDKHRTFSFFDDPKRVNLSRVMDRVNAKYGKNALFLGGVADVLTSAPTRIAFSSIPDITI
jgi:DNA polymerase-4